MPRNWREGGRRSFESAENSSTTLLAADEEFNGPEETNDYMWATVIVSSDTPGIAVLEYSYDDGDSWLSHEVAVEGGAQRIESFLVLTSLVRIKYVNGNTDQSDFHLKLVFSEDNPLDPTAVADSTSKTDAILAQILVEIIEQSDLLRQSLYSLRIMNLHLRRMTDEEFTYDDIDDDEEIYT